MDVETHTSPSSHSHSLLAPLRTHSLFSQFPDPLRPYGTPCILSPPRGEVSSYTQCVTWCPATSCRFFTFSFSHPCSASLTAAPGRTSCLSLGHHPHAVHRDIWQPYVIAPAHFIFLAIYTHRTGKIFSALSFRMRKHRMHSVRLQFPPI